MVLFKLEYLAIYIIEELAFKGKKHGFLMVIGIKYKGDCY